MDEFKRRSNIFLLYSFLTSIHIFNSVLMIFYTDIIHFGMKEILILQTVYQITITLMEIPTGVFGDKHGRKLSTIIGNVLYAIGISFYAIAYKIHIIGIFTLLVIAEILMGTGRAFISGAESALQYDSLKDIGQEQKFFEFLTNKNKISNIASILSGIIAFLLLKFNMVPLAFFIYGMLLTLASLIILFSINEPKIQLKTELVPNYKNILENSFKIFKVNHSLRLFSILQLLQQLILYYIFYIGQKYLLSIGINRKWIPIHFLIRSLLLILINHYLPTWKKLIGLKQILRINVVIIFSADILMLVLTHKPIDNMIATVSVLVFTIITISYSTISPFLNDLIQKEVPSHIRSTVISFNSFASTITSSISNPLIGITTDINIRMTFYSILFGNLFILNVIKKHITKTLLNEN